MTSFIRAIAFVLGATLIAVSPALAATISNVDDGRLHVDSALSSTLIGGGTWLAGPDTVSGSVKSDYRSTFESGDGIFASEAERTASYFRVRNSDTAILKVARSSALSVLWGSIDSYNSITLRDTLTGSALVVTLADLPGAVVGLGASLVSITGFLFDRVEFWSSGNSLEFSNISTVAVPALQPLSVPAPVPVPAAALLLLTGLGGLGMVRSRRKAG